jgi:hypothetical protein
VLSSEPSFWSQLTRPPSGQMSSIEGPYLSLMKTGMVQPSPFKDTVVHTIVEAISGNIGIAIWGG